MTQTQRPILWFISPATPLALALGLLTIALAGCEGQAPGPNTSESVLDAFSPPTPAEAAQWAIDPYNPDKRQRGLLLLANAPFGGERVYLELYRNALSDGDSAVRAVALKALAMHGLPEDVPRITPFLRDEVTVVRREAARALQRLHDQRAVGPLIAATNPDIEEDIDVRANAARALGQYARRDVFYALIDALRDRRLVVNQNAAESLRVLTGQSLGYAPRDWRDWASEQRDLFAERQEYIYPVFQRDPTIVEFILPYWNPPNETPARPVGMPVAEGVGEADAAQPPEGREGG